MMETTTPIEQIATRDRIRSRSEERRIEVFDVDAAIVGEDWAPHIESAVRVTRNTFVKNAQTGLWRHRAETALHVSSTKLSAQQAAKAIRGHWSIENRNHYVRDTAFDEDQSRIRSNPGIFARLTSCALNILRANQAQNIKDALWKNALSFNKTLQLNGL